MIEKPDIKIMIAIGGSLLIAAFVLMYCFLSLICKLGNILRAPKAPVCFILKNNPAMAIQDRVAASTPITPGSDPNVLYCEECSLYADFDPLPCFCDVDEGF